LLADLAEAVHIITRTKVAGDSGDAAALSAEERRRASTLANALSVPLLARAWQMLLKGLEDAARAPDAIAAVEMVLIRIAHTADLPTPDDLIKTLGGGVLSAGKAGPPSPREERRNEHRDERTPLNTAARPAQPEEPPPPTAGGISEAVAMEAFDRPDDLFDEMDGIGPAESLADAFTGAADVPIARTVITFADVVALASEQRDVKLKMQLEEYVSLVKFDAAAGSIDFYLLPGGPQELANELREKLNRWTGRRWMVVLSKTAGAPAIGPERRRRESAELEILKQHPAVKAVLDEFPDAKISEVRKIAALPGHDLPPLIGGETGT
jgi:DNA polymerase-3 subunit gamma/tau